MRTLNPVPLKSGRMDHAPKTSEALFTPKSPVKDEMPVNAWAIAALVVMVVVGAFLLLGRHKPTGPLNSLLPLDPYAANLPLSHIVMSESTSLSGGKSTFIDGRVRNTGGATVSGVTVQVLFRNDEALPPQVETLPLMLIRTHEPYVDTQSVSAAPLKPGDEQEFRLIFEALPKNWNTQVPEIHLVRVNIR